MFDIAVEIGKFADPKNVVVRALRRSMDDILRDVQKDTEGLLAHVNAHTDLTRAKFLVALELMYSSSAQQIFLKRDLTELRGRALEVMGLDSEDDMLDFEKDCITAAKNTSPDLAYLGLVDVLSEPLGLLKEEVVEVLQEHVNSGMKNMVKEMLGATLSLLKLYGERMAIAIRDLDIARFGELCWSLAYAVSAVLDRVPGVAVSTPLYYMPYTMH